MKKSILLALAATSVVLAVVSPATAGKPDPACSASPNAVSLNQSYTVSAWGLPTGGSAVNMIVTYPNGTTLTSSVTVASDGTYTLTQSSANAMPAEQTGSYTYEFVGKIRWPQGAFNQSYATCSIHVG